MMIKWKYLTQLGVCDPRCKTKRRNYAPKNQCGNQLRFVCSHVSVNMESSSRGLDGKLNGMDEPLKVLGFKEGVRDSVISLAFQLLQCAV